MLSNTQPTMFWIWSFCQGKNDEQLQLDRNVRKCCGGWQGAAKGFPHPPPFVVFSLGIRVFFLLSSICHSLKAILSDVCSNADVFFLVVVLRFARSLIADACALWACDNSRDEKKKQHKCWLFGVFPERVKEFRFTFHFGYLFHRINHMVRRWAMPSHIQYTSWNTRRFI